MKTKTFVWIGVAMYAFGVMHCFDYGRDSADWKTAGRVLSVVGLVIGAISMFMVAMWKFMDSTDKKEIRP